MSKDTLRPEYYNTDSVYEPIKIIQHYGLCFELSNNLKYILRAGVKNKDTEIEDLIKAKTYLQLRIDYLQAQKGLTINIKCENNLSPVLEEMHEKVLDIKKELSEDELAIEKFIAINKQEREDQFKPLTNPDQPKLISELKIGDEIKSINDMYMEDSNDMCLANDKYYTITSESSLSFFINSEYTKNHSFSKNKLDQYFHVIK